MHKTTCLLFALLVCTLQSFAADNAPSRWEGDIAAFEQWDSKNSFPQDAVLFVGSSSIRMWPTRESFPDIPVINRGFGGSQTSDAVEFAHRIVLPYKPRLIVFYEGDNDIASGKTPQQVFADYQSFVKIVHDKLPSTPIICMFIKPSKSRLNLWPRMEKANNLIKEYSAKDTRLFCVDGATPLLTADGTPDDKFYKDDKLHLSPEGYKIWNNLLSPITEIYDVGLSGKSLALFLISKGMGPHDLTPERVASLSFAPRSSSAPLDSKQSATTGNSESSYISSKNSKIFHRASCRFAATISDKNRIVYNTREDAIRAGKRPCMRCSP